MPDPAPREIAIPRTPWRERLRPAHVLERLREMRVIGRYRIPLPDRGRLLLSQGAHLFRLIEESRRRPVEFEPLFLHGNHRSGTS